MWLKQEMTTRIANGIWRRASVGFGSPCSGSISSLFRLQPTTVSACRDRYMSTDFKHNRSLYDENRDYESEITVPGLKYGTQVMSFGDGSSGALGHHTEGYLSDVCSPETIEGLPKNILKVTAGHYHSLAVTEDGEVWAWGRNSEGQLGPRDGNSRKEWFKPERVKGLEHVKVKDVAGSGVISMALAIDGSLWSWGSSKRGQLGLGPNVIQSKLPQQLRALAGQQVSQIALGWGHALACTTVGELYAWGYAADGRLGYNPEQLHPGEDGSFQAREFGQRSETLTRSEAAEAVEMHVQSMLQNEQTVVPAWKPRRVEALAHTRLTNIACGMDHSLALAENGDLYSFGDNSLGQLGRPLSKEIVGVVEFPNATKVISIAAGLGHSLAVALNPHSNALPAPLPMGLNKPLTPWEKNIEEAANGSLFSWGWNSGSQLGRAGDPYLPGLVEGLTEARLVQIAAGRVHSAGLSAKRQVWIWGSGRNGRLGLDSSVDEPHPFPIERLGFWKTLQVACGFDHSLLLIRTIEHSPHKGSCVSHQNK